MRYLTLKFGIIALVFMVIAACAQKPPRAIITFDYTPIPDAAPGSANVTFAIINTQFEGPVALFSTFADNMAKDFAEILTAHGFGIRGPFISYDNMTYSDRQQSDLTLTAEVNFTPDTSQIQWGFGGRPNGLVIIKCHLNLIVSKSLTNERLWTRSVAIKPFTVPLSSGKFYSTQANLATFLINDNQFYSDVGRALEIQYTEIMNKIYGYLNTKEMVTVAQAARDLRETQDTRETRDLRERRKRRHQ